MTKKKDSGKKDRPVTPADLAQVAGAICNILGPLDEAQRRKVLDTVNALIASRPVATTVTNVPPPLKVNAKRHPFRNGIVPRDFMPYSVPVL